MCRRGAGAQRERGVSPAASETHGVAHLLDGLLGDASGFGGTVAKELADSLRVCGEGLTFLAKRDQLAVEVLEEDFFAVYAAPLGGGAFAEGAGDLVRGREDLVHCVDVADVGIARVAFAETFWVGEGAAEFAPEGVRGVEEWERVAFGLAHFGLSIEAHDAGSFGQAGLGLEEDGAEAMVEATGGIACELEVLDLVFADGDYGGFVEQDIGGHEDWVLEEAASDEVASFALFFELGHT